MRLLLKFLLLLFFCISLFHCSKRDPLLAGGTEDGNPAISGKVLDENGNALAEVEVTLIPNWYQPRDSLGIKGLISTKTDQEGQFEFSHIKMDTYNVIINDDKQNKSALVEDVIVSETDSTIDLGETTVKGNATLLIVLDDITQEEGGIIYIPGTPFYVPVDSAQILSGVLEINNLPPINYDTIFFLQDFLQEPDNILEDTLHLTPDSTITLSSTDTLKYSALVRFNMSLLTLTNNLHNYPLVIRLNESNFDFSLPKNDGSDLQFFSKTSEILPHEIEYWNSGEKLGVLWVLVDTIDADKIEQSVTLKWGKENPLKKSGVVFDTSNGFGAVYHMGDNPAGDKVNSIIDVTQNKIHGSPTGGMKNRNFIDGEIGKAINFDGAIDGVYPSSPDPGFYHNPNSEYTISAWYLPESTTQDTSIVFDIGGKTNGFVLAYDAVNNKALFGINSDSTSIHRVTSTSAVKSGGSDLFYVTGVFIKDTISIFINGVKEASKHHGRAVPYHPDSPGIGRMNQCSFIFKDPIKVCDASTNEWNGIIDEVRASGKARSDEWVLMNFITQNSKSDFITIIRL